jgi:glutaredoxin 3
VKELAVTVKVLIYSTTICPYCVRAKTLLKHKGVDFTEILIDEDDKMREEMVAKSNRMTVPQIFINDHPIGGCDDLYELERLGKLTELLKG